MSSIQFSVFPHASNPKFSHFASCPWRCPNLHTWFWSSCSLEDLLGPVIPPRSCNTSLAKRKGMKKGANPFKVLEPFHFGNIVKQDMIFSVFISENAWAWGLCAPNCSFTLAGKEAKNSKVSNVILPHVGQAQKKNHFEPFKKIFKNFQQGNSMKWWTCFFCCFYASLRVLVWPWIFPFRCLVLSSMPHSLADFSMSSAKVLTVSSCFLGNSNGMED